MTRPDLLLVHGAWHGAWAFDPLLPELSAAGFTVRTVDLPSSGDAGSGLQADADVVRRSLADHPAPTMVVGHSYGGIVVSEACAGAADVVAVSYVCAFLLDVGDALGGAFDVLPDWIAVDGEAGVSRPLRPESVFYADVPAEQQQAMVARIGPQSLRSFGDAQTAAAWREVPSSYLVCQDDQAIPVAAQEAMSARAGFVERLAVSHSPFASQPAAVAAFLGRAADQL